MAFVNVVASPQNPILPKIDYLKLLKDTFEFSWRVSYQRTFKGQIVVSSWAIQNQKHQKQSTSSNPTFILPSIYTPVPVKMFTIFCWRHTKLDPHFPSPDLTSSSRRIFFAGAFLSKYEVVALVKKLPQHGCPAKEFPLSYTFLN